MSRRSGPTSTDPVSVPTGTESRAIDRRAIEVLGVPSSALMERAGTHAADAIVRLTGVPPSGCVVVLAGGGDNGGDARIVARCLHLWGYRVELLETAEDLRTPVLARGVVTPEATAALGDDLLVARLAAADVVIDGMLGTGQSGELRGEVRRSAAALAGLTAERRSRPRVVALDVPTGVDASTGMLADLHVTADLTIAFGYPKLGTLLHPARAAVGRLVAVEIGFPPPAPDAATWAALDPRWASSVLPERAPRTHKNAAGSVLVVAGSQGMAGAAILAARAALRSGAGYVRVASVASNRAAVQAAVPEAVWVAREDREALRKAGEASRAIVIGPGIGTDGDAAEAFATIATLERPLVIDADALTLLARGAIELPGGTPAVLTPHPGEAARLLEVEVAAIEADRLQALERLRGTTGAVVLLKGSPTLVAGASRRLDPSASSDLATAGVGDVLAGTIAALIAQGVDSEDAASLGLWLTSSAGRIAARGPGMQSADLPDHIPAARAEVRGGAAIPAAPWILFDLEAPR